VGEEEDIEVRLELVLQNALTVFEIRRSEGGYDGGRAANLVC